MVFIFLIHIFLSNPVYVTIEKGETLSSITNKLKEEKITKHPFLFKTWVKLTRNERKLKAGRYAFEKPSSIREIVRILVRGRSFLPVTIPEGAKLREIAWLFSKKGHMDKDRFMELAFDTLFIKRLGIDENNLEGYLFPDTYFIYDSIPANEVIRMMVKRFFELWSDTLRERAEEMKFSMHEIITLASIVQAEARVKSEMPIIASVYYNRLKAERLLQCDATIQYILKKHKKRILYSDLRIDSPYNTYMYPGLPPGPICSPGEDAIKATLYPETTNYYYFVARGDGTHIFSKTAKEHERARMMVRLNKIRIPKSDSMLLKNRAQIHMD
jgi:UPF0755 protein